MAPVNIRMAANSGLIVIRAANDKGGVLPYRSDAEDLTRLLEALARGWSVQQVRSLNFSAKNFEGTTLTAQLLGLFDSEEEELTAAGRRFALAAAAERQALLLAAMREFEPYGLLLEAIFGGEAPRATEADWIERWWATNGYGSSPSNRAEAATVFGRLAEFVGLGTYIQGRRGHPTRIEWNTAPPTAPGLPPRRRVDVQAEPVPPPGTAIEEVAPTPTVAPAAAVELPAARARADEAPYSTVAVELAAGRYAQLRVPSRLTRAEKERLLSLLDLLITVVPEG